MPTRSRRRTSRISTPEYLMNLGTSRRHGRVRAAVIAVAIASSSIFCCPATDAKGTTGHAAAVTATIHATTSPSKTSFGSFGKQAATTTETKAAATPSAAPTTKAVSFGAFGAKPTNSITRSDAVPAAVPSVNQATGTGLSAALSKSAEKAQALKTLDARSADAAARTVTSQGTSTSAAWQPSTSAAPQAPRVDAAAQPVAPQPSVYVHTGGSSSLGDLVTGFMLGRATADRHTTVLTEPAAGTGAPLQPIDATQADARHQPANGHSWFSLLLTMIIVVVIAAVLLVAYQRSQRPRALHKMRYSL